MVYSVKRALTVFVWWGQNSAADVIISFDLHVHMQFFGSGTDPISLLILFFLFVFGFMFFWQHCSQKPKAASFQIGSGWNLAELFFKWICIQWQSWIFDLMSHFQDGGHDVIRCRKVLPSGKCTCSVWWHAPGPSSFGRQQRAELLCPIVQY